MKKITLREVKKWENEASDLYCFCDEMSLEEAQKEFERIYKQGIAYDYGEFDLIYHNNEFKKEAKKWYTKGAFDEVFENYNDSYKYANMRKHLIHTFFENENDYYDEFDLT